MRFSGTADICNASFREAVCLSVNFALTVIEGPCSFHQEKTVKIDQAFATLCVDVFSENQQDKTESEERRKYAKNYYGFCSSNLCIYFFN